MILLNLVRIKYEKYKKKNIYSFIINNSNFLWKHFFGFWWQWDKADGINLVDTKNNVYECTVKVRYGYKLQNIETVKYRVYIWYYNI